MMDKTAAYIQKMTKKPTIRIASTCKTTILTKWENLCENKRIWGEYYLLYLIT